MQANDLNDLYVASLRKMHDGEEKLIDALPQMADAASDRELANAFTEHRDETQKQRRRLEKILEDFDDGTSSGKCHGIAALIEEGETTIKSNADENVKDAALIAIAQQVEHFEIATYGTLCTYAERLTRPDDLASLKETLNEERSADDKLTDLAHRLVNPKAQTA